MNKYKYIEHSESIKELHDCGKKNISSKTNITDTQVNNSQKNILLEQNIKREDNLGVVASEKTSDIEEKGSYIDVI